MPAAIGPRFVLEAGFLVLLALVVGIADLDPLLIILVMAIGWLLVSLIEYFAWRQTQAVGLRSLEPAPAAVMDEAVVEDVAPPPPPVPDPEPPLPPPPPEPQPSLPPPEEETVVQPAPIEENETIAEADERVSAARRSFADRQEEDPQASRPRAPAAAATSSLDPLRPARQARGAGRG